MTSSLSFKLGKLPSAHKKCKLDKEDRSGLLHMNIYWNKFLFVVFCLAVVSHHNHQNIW